MNKKDESYSKIYQLNSDNELISYCKLIRKALKMLFIFFLYLEKNYKSLWQWIDDLPNISALSKEDLKSFLEALKRLKFVIAELSVLTLATQANLDETAPIFHPRVPGGGQNDPVGLHYREGRLHLYVQHNPYGEKAGNTCWTEIIINSDGTYEAAPRPAIAAGNVRGEEFTDAFSGSLGTDNFGRRFAVYTIVGKGEKSFEYTPPNVLVYESREREGAFENKRHPITWLDTFQNSWDSINQENMKNLYDCRDPYFFEREGKKYTLLGGTTVPGRMGSGAVALLTSDGENLTKPWRFIGLAFKQVVPHSQGGAGIFECPSISKDFATGLDILIVSIQRKKEEGNLTGFQYHQGVRCYVGKFTPEKGFVVLGLPEGEPVNYGKAEYACAVAERPDGRNTIIGDLSTGDRQERYARGDRKGWYGCISLPRIMSIRDKKLYQEPAIEGLRIATLAVEEALELESESLKLNLQTTTFELDATVSLLERQAEAKILLLAEATGIELSWNGRDLILEDETLPISETWQNNVEFKVFVDRSVIEVFSNGRVLSKIVIPENQFQRLSDDICLRAFEGKVSYQYSVYAMNYTCNKIGVRS